MERDEIEALLPHREPFLMVDRLVEVEPGVRAVGIKEVRADEDWARGHFPGNPIFPGVLITEALAQGAALIFLCGHPERAGATFYLVGVDKMRFRRVVRPGDILRLEVALTSSKRRLWFFDVAASTTQGERVANGTILATVEE